MKQCAQLCLSAMVCLLTAGKVAAQSDKSISLTKEPIRIDGIGNEKAWAKAIWLPLKYLWAGNIAAENDFKGKVKYLSDGEYLYVLAQIIDDTLIDIHRDPKDHYWDDDCLEIFVDADASGGIHQYNHTAFAYHISLAGQALDLGTNTEPLFLDNHMLQKRVCAGNLCTWEVRFNLFANTYEQGKSNNPIKVRKGSKLRIASAYCDNDYSAEREHFYGSMPIKGIDKNKAWIDASFFPIYTLK